MEIWGQNPHVWEVFGSYGDACEFLGVLPSLLNRIHFSCNKLWSLYPTPLEYTLWNCIGPCQSASRYANYVADVLFFHKIDEETLRWCARPHFKVLMKDSWKFWFAINLTLEHHCLQVSQTTLLSTKQPVGPLPPKSCVGLTLWLRSG